jgi:hypothetical protein
LKITNCNIFLRNNCNSLILFFTFVVMNKKNNNTKNSHFLLKSNAGFQVLCVTFLTSIKMILNIILDITKTDTIKLPIVYANIRV